MRGACPTRRRLLSVFGAAMLWDCALGPLAWSAEKAGDQATPLRMLFIGNSYTYVNDLPALLRALAVEARETRQIETRTVGSPGATLKGHWEKGEAKRMLMHGRWDFVVLQEQSLQPIVDPGAMFVYARLFDREIKRHGSRTILFVTWAREDRLESQASIDSSYAALSTELGALLAPIGGAWQRVLKQDPRLALYQPDHSHPTVAGSYVGACVFYSLIYGKPLRSLGQRPPGVSGDGADLAQRAAWEELQALR